MEKGKPGRRPRRATPMPSTSFSAPVEQLVFLILLGDGGLSKGVQDAVTRLLEVDEEMADLMARANGLITRVEQVLDRDEFGRVPQKALYLYVSQNYHELVS